MGTGGAVRGGKGRELTERAHGGDESGALAGNALADTALACTAVNECLRNRPSWLYALW